MLFQIAARAPNTPYPERAFTSPIFVEPITATHGLLVAGAAGHHCSASVHPGHQG